MSYNAGLMNSPTPAAHIMGLIDPIIQAHAAWEFVEQVVSGTETARVYRCLAAENGRLEFYVVVRRSADAGNLGFELCENWDAVNKLLLRYAPADQAAAGAGTYVGLAADGSVGAVGRAFNDASVAWNPLAILANSDVPWFLSVTAHRICLAVGQQGWWYVGLYESITDAGRDPAPLVNLGGADVHTSLHASSGSNDPYPVSAQDESSNYNFTNNRPSGASSAPSWPSGTYTRQLLVAAGNQTRTNFQALLKDWTMFNMVSNAVTYSGYGGVTNDQSEPVSGKWLPSRVALGHLSFARASGNSGDLRGWMRDVLSLTMYGYSPVNGDEIVVDGVTYTRMGSIRRRMRDFWIPQNA